MTDTLEKFLQKKFQLDAFRPGQKEIITALLNGQNTLGILPTGSGKSLCYQFTAYQLAGSTIIVSPLISLMEDQVLQLQKQGEKAVVALTGGMYFSEKQWLLQHLEAFRFIFMSPEMLLQAAVLKKLQTMQIAQLVIDEIHCVSLWGNDFRPEYRQLAVALKTLNSPLLMGLTATATPKVIADIKSLFYDEQDFIYQASVERSNITLFVEKVEDKFVRLKDLLAQTVSPGIIYCGTRKMVESISHELRSSFNIGYYHGGLASNERRQLQQQFTNGNLDWLVATNAFGMGINKKDIRTIIHYDLSDSLENYVQEIGRAGRDGLPSQAILLYKNGDESLHHFFQRQRQEERKIFEYLVNHELTDESNFSELQAKWLEESQWESSEKVIQRLTQHETEKNIQLMEMLNYIDYKSCRREKLLDYFAEAVSIQPAQCCDYHQAQLLANSRQKNILNEENYFSWQDILKKLFKESTKVKF